MVQNWPKFAQKSKILKLEFWPKKLEFRIFEFQTKNSSFSSSSFFEYRTLPLSKMLPIPVYFTVTIVGACVNPLKVMKHMSYDNT